MRENGRVPHESHDTDPTHPVTPKPDREGLVEARANADAAAVDAASRDAANRGATDLDADAAGRASAREEHETAAIPSEHEVRVRRTPRYGRFMILGGAVFAVAAFIVTYSLPQGEGYDRNTVFGFVLLTAVAVGVGLGALAAIIASAATKHTERTVIADRIDVHAEPSDETDDDAARALELGELPSEVERGAGESAGDDVADRAGDDAGDGAGERAGDTGGGSAADHACDIDTSDRP
jgi:hypothetical protein